MRIILLISLLYWLAVSQPAAPPSIPVDLEIKAKCVFPSGTIYLKDSLKPVNPVANSKRALTVTGSLTGLCPTSSYTLSFVTSN